jgi:CheY-like chemotaxis protein
MDLKKSLDDCCSIIEGQLTNRSIEFIKDYQTIEHPYVLGDELHLRQILINILGNAVKFTPDGGSITLKVCTTSLTDNTVTYQFDIEDTGIGMSEEYLLHIFEPFSQEDGGSRTHYKGTGLGMAITKQLVTLLGGSIQVYSKVNEGSRFTFDLTFTIDTERPNTTNNTIEEEPNVDISQLRVLLVEDNELNLEIAQSILEEAGVTVTTATNGKDAVTLFESSPPNTYDVILMDIMMPIMDGLTASRTIRSSNHPEAKTIPIVAMTANAYREDIDKALESGMNEHISKPIDIPKLFSILSHYKKV